MNTFSIITHPCDIEIIRQMSDDPASGAYVSFEGRVRNHHHGMRVRHLEYEAFMPLALIEGQRIIDEATQNFSLNQCHAIHRIGQLFIGDLAVIVCVSSAHRDTAFLACRYVIDQIKERVPIWKKEHYQDDTSSWITVNNTSDK